MIDVRLEYEISATGERRNVDSPCVELRNEILVQVISELLVVMKNNGVFLVRIKVLRLIQDTLRPRAIGRTPARELYGHPIVTFVRLEIRQGRKGLEISRPEKLRQL